MSLTPISAPTGFSATNYHGTYGSDSDVTNEMWNTFLDTYFPEDGNGPYNEYMYSDQGGQSWPPPEMTTYGEHRIIEGIFGAALKDFSYDYLPQKESESGATLDRVSTFKAYLEDPNRSGSAKNQATVLLWIWEVLTETLERFHEASPTKGGYALAMAAAEKASVDALEGITFVEQTSSTDYSSQEKNMEAQKESELYRSYRAIVGKKGQDAQAMMSTTRDTASNHSQLMSSILQAMESMIQAIIKR